MDKYILAQWTHLLVFVGNQVKRPIAQVGIVDCLGGELKIEHHDILGAGYNLALSSIVRCKQLAFVVYWNVFVVNRSYWVLYIS